MMPLSAPPSLGRHAFIALTLTAVVLGCSDERTHEPSPDPRPADVASANDLSADTSKPDTAIAPVPVEPALELGVNETGKNTPEFYSGLTQGGELTIEYGPQGLWMVVLAFRTKGIWEPGDELRITTRCWIGEENIGELVLAKQRLLPGPEGWSYYYNLFLVVDEVGAAGNDARVSLLIESKTGETETLERVVRLIGGPP